ncbi:MAG: carboxypeptidase-like regulatory domain-containing protein [Chitinophagaceae bacterium]|nr:carboxypeptidase-like regulatory domain-containing protein [Chitinophagaceae bacterium]MCW5904774.1 carboxypeptidase-like regulatory domain-containing protein [Chitinophagaceae bacterium]
MRWFFFIVLITFHFSNNCFGQKIIQGTVKDSSHKNIIGATITVELQSTKVVVAFSFTNENGFYKIELPEKYSKRNCVLKVSSLNFLSKEKLIDSLSASTVTHHFILKSSQKKLSEVIVQSSPPITAKKDTINYNVESYTSKYDRSIGDVIQKLPGIEVMSDGTIKYQGKPINKFYIDGKDLLAGRYNIATANVPSDAVDKVQVLENHQPIKVLDSFSVSNRAALNLVLKDKARNKIIGKAKLGIGYPFISTDNEVVPLFFSKNYQSIATVKYNNIGKDYANEFKYLYNDDYNEIIFLNKYYGEIVSINKPQAQGIELDKFYTNNQFSASINQLTLTKNNNELKCFIDFVHDKTYIKGNTATTIFYTNDTFKIAEANNYYQKESTLKAGLQYIVNKPTYNFSNFTNFQLSQKYVDAVITNPKEILQASNYKRVEILNTSKYVFRKQNHLFNLSLVAGYKQDPQHLLIHNERYDPIFTKTPNPSYLLEEVSLKSPFASFDASWAYKVKSNFSITNLFSTSYFFNSFNTLFSAGNKDSSFTLNKEFNNDFLFNQFVVTNSIGVNYKLSKFNASINIPYSFNSINRKQANSITSNYTNHFVGFRADVHYTINKYWKLSTTAYNQFRLSPSYITSNNYILYNYRYLNNNNSIFPSYKSFNAESYINYRNVTKYTFITIGFIYTKNTNSPISDKEFINSLTIGKALPGNANRISNRVIISYNKFLPKLKSSITAQASFERAVTDNYSNKIMTKFYNNNFQAFLKTNTNFKNISIDTKTKLNLYRNNSAAIKTNNFSVFEESLTLKMPVSHKAFITLNTIYNSIRKSNTKPIDFLYPDFYITYSLDKLKTDIEIGGQNLFNQKTYTNIAFYGNTETINQIELRPFQIILKATVYFK